MRKGGTKSAAGRQAAFKARQAAAGLVQVNVWLPAHAAASFRDAAARVTDAHAAGRELEAARQVDRATGKLSGVRKPSPR